MSEPTYIYVKGQGWVPSQGSGKFVVLFKTGPNDKWTNVGAKGYKHDTYESAQGSLDNLVNLVNLVNSYISSSWKFKIVPAEHEFTDE